MLFFKCQSSSKTAASLLRPRLSKKDVELFDDDEIACVDTEDYHWSDGDIMVMEAVETIMEGCVHWSFSWTRLTKLDAKRLLTMTMPCKANEKSEKKQKQRWLLMNRICTTFDKMQH